MKRLSTFGVLCVAGSFALVAAARAQDPATNQTQSTSQQTTTKTTTIEGKVVRYEPGKTIVVRGEQGPVSFALGTAANIVDAAGKAVTAPLRSGQRVRVYYTGPTEHRTVERVIVEE